MRRMGLICAALLPAVIRVNAELLSQSTQDHHKLSRFEEIAHWITGSARATVQDGVDWIADLADSMRIRGLADLGIQQTISQPLLKKQNTPAA